MSRDAARSLIVAGGVVCNGSAVTTPRAAVAAGAVLEFEPPSGAVPLEPEDVAFDVVYEDAHVAVVSKPAGVVTHPGAGETGATLAAGILHRWPSVRGVGSEQRWGIVHRLDRDTSGLLAVALTPEAERGLRAAIKARRVSREYLALVHGTPATPTGTIDAPIARDPTRPTRMRIDPSGRGAVTHFRVEETLGAMTLLRVTLETGRTHQIRVHLAAIGLPIAGDRVYGKAVGSPRVFLHAARLVFEHPVTGAPIEATSALPPDLAAALAAAR
ncbi:MAG: RluA family pseudouridine synthase [Acidimicrobiia bacterium]|nr:RluA family pseudouridine synthase [Acidimicrobiia bacterium]